MHTLSSFSRFIFVALFCTRNIDVQDIFNTIRFIKIKSSDSGLYWTRWWSHLASVFRPHSRRPHCRHQYFCTIRRSTTVSTMISTIRMTTHPKILRTDSSTFVLKAGPDRPSAFDLASENLRSSSKVIDPSPSSSYTDIHTISRKFT